MFATTYLELTKTLREILREDPNFVQYPKYLYVEDALFANVYFNAIRDARRGQAGARRRGRSRSKRPSRRT